MSGSIHPIHEIREIINELDAADDPDMYAETIRKIRDVVNREYEFWYQADTAAMWQLGYSVRRRYHHPDTFPFVNPERVYLEEWAHEESDQQAGVNSGMSTLQHLLSENPPTFPMHLHGDDDYEHPMCGSWSPSAIGSSRRQSFSGLAPTWGAVLSTVVNAELFSSRKHNGRSRS